MASNSPRSFVQTALASAGLADLFAYVLAAEDVRHPKPAPDLYLAACTALNADSAPSVAFEDSRTGAISAHAAGLYVVGVPSLPGVVPHTDATFDSLIDSDLVDWAAAAATPATDASS